MALHIAREIADAPEVRLLDETTSAIDPIATARIGELVDSLKASFTLVAVPHDMQQAARISECTAFFCQGRVVEFGTTRKILTTPRFRQTRDYVTGRFG